MCIVKRDSVVFFIDYQIKTICSFAFVMNHGAKGGVNAAKE
jgi:hypothetical protein